MSKNNFESQIDFNSGLVESSINRNDFTDPTLGKERFFTIPGLTEHLGGIGILQANLDSIEARGDEG